jgi:hypothetical protein
MMALSVKAQAAWEQLTGPDGILVTDDLVQIGQGGSYRVFSVPAYDELVVKVPYQDSSRPYPVEAINQAYDALGAALPGCCPWQRAWPVRIRWSASEEAQPAHAILQERDPWIRGPGTLSMTTPYIESALTVEQLPAYRSMNDALLGGSGGWMDYCGFNPSFAAIDQACSSDARLERVLAAVLGPLAGIMREQDQLVDLVGDYNVYLRQDAERGWKVRIGTVMKFNSLSRLQGLLAEFPNSRAEVEALPICDRSLMLNGLAVLRLFNALTLRCAMPILFPQRIAPAQRAALAYLRFVGQKAPYP